MSKRTGEIRKFNTPEKCQLEIDNVIKINEETTPNVFGRIIGMKLRKKRLELNLTQTKVSIMLDVTFQQIQKYERGINLIPLRNIWKFCVITDTDINWFFEEIKKESKKLEEPIPFVVDSIQKGS